MSNIVHAKDHALALRMLLNGEGSGGGEAAGITKVYELIYLSDDGDVTYFENLPTGLTAEDFIGAAFLHLQGDTNNYYLKVS